MWLNKMKERFSKGYKEDAGVDIILDKDIKIVPKMIDSFNLGVCITPKKNHMAIIAPRSSYAKRGLLICNCPIDANYTGDVHAIVANCGEETIEVKKGESFCQVMFVKIKTIKNVKIRKNGKRKDGNFGSTGR